ncbi:hypothetical protein BC833DRAFT_607629 [Globomyces pollinis-pini]|nr:hypothetical protein BC833DRAFT_607629 [Globomyces pollinis-pini]
MKLKGYPEEYWKILESQESSPELNRMEQVIVNDPTLCSTLILADHHKLSMDKQEYAIMNVLHLSNRLTAIKWAFINDFDHHHLFNLIVTLPNLYELSIDDDTWEHMMDYYEQNKIFKYLDALKLLHVSRDIPPKLSQLPINIINLTLTDFYLDQEKTKIIISCIKKLINLESFTIDRFACYEAEDDEEEAELIITDLEDTENNDSSVSINVHNTMDMIQVENVNSDMNPSNDTMQIDQQSDDTNQLDYVLMILFALEEKTTLKTLLIRIEERLEISINSISRILQKNKSLNNLHIKSVKLKSLYNLKDILISSLELEKLSLHLDLSAYKEVGTVLEKNRSIRLLNIEYFTEDSDEEGDIGEDTDDDWDTDSDIDDEDSDEDGVDMEVDGGGSDVNTPGAQPDVVDGEQVQNEAEDEANGESHESDWEDMTDSDEDDSSEESTEDDYWEFDSESDDDSDDEDVSDDDSNSDISDHQANDEDVGEMDLNELSDHSDSQDLYETSMSGFATYLEKNTTLRQINCVCFSYYRKLPNIFHPIHTVNPLLSIKFVTLNGEELYNGPNDLIQIMNSSAKNLLIVSRYIILFQSLINPDVLNEILEYFLVPFIYDQHVLKTVLCDLKSIGIFTSNPLFEPFDYQVFIAKAYAFRNRNQS